MDQEKQLWYLYPWGDFAKVQIVQKITGPQDQGNDCHPVLALLKHLDSRGQFWALCWHQHSSWLWWSHEHLESPWSCFQPRGASPNPCGPDLSPLGQGQGAGDAVPQSCGGAGGQQPPQGCVLSATSEHFPGPLLQGAVPFLQLDSLLCEGQAALAPSRASCRRFTGTEVHL